jgi:hypothetical protein
MAVQWEVVEMKVRTATPDHIQDRLFANGHMQVPVSVSIEAIDPATGNGYTLSAAELIMLRLVDYNSPMAQLSTPWTYSYEENEFHHVLPGTASSEMPQPDASNPTAGLVTRIFWVSTSRVEHKNIGASLLTPKGWYHTGGGTGQSDSHVTITGIAPLHYNMSNVEFSGYQNIANGKFANFHGIYDYDQDNYYLSSKLHPFKKSQITGGFFWPADDPPIEHCYVRGSWGTSHQKTYMHYLWPIGLQQMRQAGNKNAAVSISINQRRGALCLTRLVLEGPRLYPDVGGEFTGQFTIWDEYGNWGKFRAGNQENYNLITISADNSLLDEELSPSEKFTPISPEEAASLDSET